MQNPLCDLIPNDPRQNAPDIGSEAMLDELWPGLGMDDEIRKYVCDMCGEMMDAEELHHFAHGVWCGDCRYDARQGPYRNEASIRY